jgi:hypothetical protein
MGPPDVFWISYIVDVYIKQINPSTGTAMLQSCGGRKKGMMMAGRHDGCIFICIIADAKVYYS